MPRIIPSNRWFPTNLPARAVWFQNFATQFAAIAASLGFLPADVAIVQDDNTVVQFLADIREQLKAFESAIRQYTILITEGAIGEPTPAFPANPAFALPEIVPTGIWQRLNELVERIRVAPAYTDEIGALLGIIPSSPGPTPEVDLKPVIKVSESFGDYKFDVNVTRLGQPSFKVQIQRAGETTWTDAAFGTKNPVTVTVTPTTPGQPESGHRAVFLKQNAVFGNFSTGIHMTLPLTYLRFTICDLLQRRMHLPLFSTSLYVREQRFSKQSGRSSPAKVGLFFYFIAKPCIFLQNRAGFEK